MNKDIRSVIERKLKHAIRHLRYYDDKYANVSEMSLTYHGGWSIGYWEAKVSAYEDLLDDLDIIEGVVDEE